MKFIASLFIFATFLIPSAFAGSARTPSQSLENCSHTKPFACFGGGAPQSCTVTNPDGTESPGFRCKELPGQENVATEDVAVNVRCLKAKPIACPGGGAPELCPGHSHLWMCHALPTPQ